MTLQSENEARRLGALADYYVFGSPPEKEFDRIVKMMSELFSVPTALIGFMGEHSHHFKARFGFDACDASRAISFCTHTVNRADLLVIPDTMEEPAYRGSPLVQGPPGIRFYAGAPILTRDGLCIGAISIIDYVPREPLSESQKGILRSLAEMVMDHLSRRRLLSMRRAMTRLASSIPDAIICTNQDDMVTFWNQGAETLTGVLVDQAKGCNLGTLMGPDFKRVLMQDPRGKDVEAEHLFILRTDGTKQPVEVSSTSWAQEDEYQRGFVIRDVSQRRNLQNRVRYLRDTDSLTDLPNRGRFLKMTQAFLDKAEPITVLKVGLDKFKAVNSSLGMVVGDELLREAARRVSAVAREESMVARLAGDEYGVLLSGDQNSDHIRELSGAIAQELSRPFRISGFECRVSASIGVASSVACGEFFLDSADLLKRALLALHEAKCLGGGQCVTFTDSLRERAENMHHLEQDLRRAFKQKDFELHYQPQVALDSGSIVGAEALLRWRHPEPGLVSPGEFIGVLEISEQALRVGDWILETACAFAAVQRGAHEAFRMGVNLFACQLNDPALSDKVAALLRRHELPPQALELEITETTILESREEVLDSLHRLRELGVGIAFDDYGTGYASLSLLKKYPLTRLKIDRQFVLNLQNNPDDLAIVKSIIALGKALGLETIAEGIEEQSHCDILNRLGCLEGQGFWFSRPIPESEFPDGAVPR